MTPLESAKYLAKKGFKVFPLKPNSKLPAIEDFPNRASSDVNQIEKWWMDPVLGIEQPYNVGISTTSFADGEALVVVDVDNKGKKKGDAEILRLELEGSAFPPTFEQITPTGGRHLIYKSKTPVKQGVDKLGDGLDIRSQGGYIVGAGSVLENGVYKLVERGIEESPFWLISKLTQATPKTEKAKAPENIDKKRAEERTIHYLTKEAPLAIEGQAGDLTTYKVAARVKDFGVSEDRCFQLLGEYWNFRCEPPWPHEELMGKVRHAYKYGAEPVGASSPEADFKPIKTEAEISYLEKINQEFALVYIEGSHAILHETVDEKGRPKRSLLSEPTFKRMFSTKTVQVGKGRPPTWAEEWIDWPGRREYAGLCFTPEKEPKFNYYNLWRGFTVKPVEPKDATPNQKKGLEMFLSHAKENVCGGEEDLYTWLIGYFAHMIQKPYEKPLTTLVFKGRKGTGKNALIDRVGKLLGSAHYLVAHDSRYLTSNFNGHMDSCLMLVLDEAFWSGDKSAEGKLKGITTAPEIMIERKGKEAYMVDNYVRLVVIGNEDWIVPASQDERRYAVFQMGEGKMQKNEFFRKMRVYLDEEGGSGLLLHYLKNFDLSKVDVNTAPKTQALLEQKMRSGTPLEQWWVESLQEGIILNSEFTEEWPDRISKEALHQAFTNYCRSRNIHQKFSDSAIAFGRKLKQLVPGLDTHQKVKDGVEKRKNAYNLPSLDHARKDWSHYVGQEVKW